MGFALTHGECVGIGSILASAISEARGMISREDYKQICQLLTWFGFPGLPENLSGEKVIQEMKHDKKMEQGIIKFILLDRIGQARICRDVTPDVMMTAFSKVSQGD